jgi:hypothetical protein
MAFRVRAVEARRQALPRKYIESWRSERAEVMGVLWYVDSGAAAGRGGALTGCGGGGCGGVVGLLIIRTTGAGLKYLEGKEGIAVLVLHSGFLQDPRAGL